MLKSFNNKGQAMVETVLVLPVLLLILIGILDFGRIFYTRVALENSARNAARIGIITNSDAEINQTVLETTSDLDSSSLVISILPIESVRHSGEALTVSISYDVPIYTPLMSNVIGNPVTVSADVTMRVE